MGELGHQGQAGQRRHRRETISPRPLLLIVGSEADTLYFSLNAYEKAKEPRELFIIPSATHIDLYYRKLG